MARRYPHVTVRADVLFRDLGDVVSSAGTAVSLGCCLHLVRSDLGAQTAMKIARRLVFAPHRSGSQPQFIPVPERDVACAHGECACGAALDCAAGPAPGICRAQACLPCCCLSVLACRGSRGF
jgi:hypothetical protein